MALPAIADVRRGAPSAHITVAARAAVAPLFQLVPETNDTIVLGGPASVARVASWRAIGTELSGCRFDAALLLPNSVHAALVAYRAGIPERWGYANGVRGSWLTRSVPRDSSGHQVDYYRRLVAALGFANGSREPHICVPDAARATGDRLLRDAGWDGAVPLVALAPGAAYGGAKRWPPQHFGELARTLAGDGVACVMVGSGADAAAAAEVSRHAGTRVLSVVGRTDLPALAGVLARCRTLVTNDSGAMHLAAAAGVPVTAMFGPTREHATGPLGDAHVVLTHDVWCRPCMLRECPLDHACMRGIAPAAVATATRRTWR
jgi:heptosyltransferase-2